MAITIYHNPACSTSCKVLNQLREKGHQPQVIEYLKTPPTRKTLQDLLKKMNLEEKAGMMFYSATRTNKDGSIEEQPAKDFLASMSPVGLNEMDKHHITHFNLFAVPAPDTLAMWYNRMQQHAEKTRLGIPLTIASDPRNQDAGGFFNMSAKTFSIWPDPLGLAAIGDDKLMEDFAIGPHQSRFGEYRR